MGGGACAQIYFNTLQVLPVGGGKSSPDHCQASDKRGVFTAHRQKRGKLQSKFDPFNLHDHAGLFSRPLNAV